VKIVYTLRLCAAAMLLAGNMAVCSAAEPNFQLDAQADVQARLKANPHKILFEAYENDNWDICVINADGSGRRNLTNTPDAHEMYPQASPDGSKIAFLVDEQKGRDTLRSVYYMNADGSDRTLVAEKARQPCWGPKSVQIAFVPQEFSRFRIADYVSTGLSVYDTRSAETTEATNKKIHHLYGLSWSGDGKWIVSTVHGGMGYGHAILAIELDSTQVFDIGIPGCRPCLSDDGTRITWSSDDHTIRAAEIELTDKGPKLKNDHVVYKHATLHLYHPDYSPDGQLITFSSGPGGRVPASGPGTHAQVAEMVGVRGPWDLFVVPFAGGVEPLQLTNDASLSNKESEWIRTAKGK